jgi:hypothetical protein
VFGAVLVFACVQQLLLELRVASEELPSDRGAREPGVHVAGVLA